jgi:ketosteroid isomerase-like protein
MAEENVEIVRRVLRRVNDQDLDALIEDVDPDAELDWSDSQGPDSGIYSGSEGWRAWVRGRWEGFSGLRFEVLEAIDVQPDTVVVVARQLGQGRASGLEVDAVAAGVWTLRDGKVTGLKLFQTREDALEALGLSQ